MYTQIKKIFPWLSTAMIIINACHIKNTYPLVSTFVGCGVMGSVNGKGTAASFANMMGITADEAGNIFVADSHNNMIRKISPDGVVTILAGNSVPGSSDGKGPAASFFNPGGVAADKSGNIYVADTHNSLIRKINPDGVVTTIAGRKAGNYIDSTARFDNPIGIAVDGNNNIYVADQANDLIRKISPGGKVTNLAGSGVPGSENGTGSKASFYLPGGIAVDSSGNVYVSDSYNNMIRKISAGGVVTTLAGQKTKGAANGTGIYASFLHPQGIAVDIKGNVYVADMGNNKIRMITPAGIVSTLAGSGVRGSKDGRDTTASFYRPYGVAIDKNGNLYVADYQNNLIRKISY